jgi:hypothetical protein
MRINPLFKLLRYIGINYNTFKIRARLKLSR